MHDMFLHYTVELDTPKMTSLLIFITLLMLLMVLILLMVLMVLMMLMVFMLVMLLIVVYYVGQAREHLFLPSPSGFQLGGQLRPILNSHIVIT